MPSCRFFSHIPTPVKWRRAIAQRNLAGQISSLLIHHKDGISVLRSRTSLLPRPLLSSFLRRILVQTHSNPDVSFRFFLFARAHLSFKPDLLDFSAIAAILVAADHFSSASQLLYPVLRSHPAPVLLDSLFHSSNYFFHSSSTTVLSKLLNFVLEIYSTLPSLCGAMETFKRIKDFQVVPSKRSCNALLDLLCSSGEFRIAWLVYASAVRIGAVMDGGSWATLARLLCKEGKLHKAEMLLNSGFCRRTSCYDLVIKCYARKRQFSSAIRVLNGMEERGFRTRLSTLSSILDESCRFGDVSLAGLMIKEMIVRGLLPVFPSVDFDWIMRRFCELGNSFAAMLIFEKAQRRSLELMSASYLCLLRALAREGRAKEATDLYAMMSKKGVAVDPSSLNVLMISICRGEPMDEVDTVIKNVIREGFLPEASDFSMYIAATCSRGRWKEATELMDLALGKEILVDASCCCLLVKHFCKNGYIELAINLHERMRGLSRCLDVDSYNALLEALVVDGRVREAIEVFDHMKDNNVLSSFSFVIMVGTLCHEKEPRKAMNLHDEMMKLGLKPETATYRRMIAGFL